jgi:hypothetical protein
MNRAQRTSIVHAGSRERDTARVMSEESNGFEDLPALSIGTGSS